MLRIYPLNVIKYITFRNPNMIKYDENKKPFDCIDPNLMHIETANDLQWLKHCNSDTILITNYHITPKIAPAYYLANYESIKKHKKRVSKHGAWSRTTFIEFLQEYHGGDARTRYNNVAIHLRDHPIRISANCEILEISAECSYDYPNVHKYIKFDAPQNVKVLHISKFEIPNLAQFTNLQVLIITR